MIPDIVEQFHGQTIQHGKYNDRIYLMKFNPDGGEDIPGKLIEKGKQLDYSKIFAKSTAENLAAFIDRGFVVEAFIPAYFEGKDDLFMVCYYLKGQRRHEEKSEEYDSVLRLAKSKKDSSSPTNKGEEEFNIRPCRHEHIAQMASIYQQVFPSYPFPIDDPEYLRKTMDEHVDYYCVEKNDRILALSSAEIDFSSGNAEMTDFATLPENRGRGYASKLLAVMERKTAAKGIKTLYTIARAISPGMNITFARQGYAFGGRLRNNTNISGSIESMNIWYKNV